ncbi:hypothetical protein F4820DRAFT_78550 [Hypoxylon rubiginosum]|uniref:Uncharacterized protein n=1 Tax=Hypoxylon rubiginosum TaxID=110542 RepID=A0ACB9ZDW7_9PEZI|nr:hypothetical protein F4820DRAFT_78550 [Hypoxylon rubiginosum]
MRLWEKMIEWRPLTYNIMQSILALTLALTLTGPGSLVPLADLQDPPLVPVQPGITPPSLCLTTPVGKHMQRVGKCHD